MIVATFRVAVFMILISGLTGLVYPMAVTGIAQVLFPDQADGSLVVENEVIIGSSLIAQKFTDSRYFYSRPSHAGQGYDAAQSGGANLAVGSKTLSSLYQSRLRALRAVHGDVLVPADLVMASGSGLDPHITPEAAYYQAARVARARGVSVDKLKALIDQNVQGRTLGVLGMLRVNVLELNLKLDQTELR